MNSNRRTQMKIILEPKMLHPQGHSEGKDIQNYQLDEQKPKEMDRN